MEICREGSRVNAQRIIVSTTPPFVSMKIGWLKSLDKKTTLEMNVPILGVIGLQDIGG